MLCSLLLATHPPAPAPTRYPGDRLAGPLRARGVKTSRIIEADNVGFHLQVFQHGGELSAATPSASAAARMEPGKEVPTDSPGQPQAPTIKDEPPLAWRTCAARAWYIVHCATGGSKVSNFLCSCLSDSDCTPADLPPLLCPSQPKTCTCGSLTSKLLPP